MIEGQRDDDGTGRRRRRHGDEPTTGIWEASESEEAASATTYSKKKLSPPPPMEPGRSASLITLSVRLPYRFSLRRTHEMGLRSKSGESLEKAWSEVLILMCGHLPKLTR